MNRIPSRYLVGSAYFRLSDSEILEPENYFKCLKLIKPLFTRQDFRESTPGFYINYIRVSEFPVGTLRLTCFSIDGATTCRSIENFVSETSAITQFQNDIETGPVPANGQNIEEMKFWNCLDTITQIVLDLLGDKTLNWQGFQSLVWGYRTSLLPLKISPRIIFEPVFKKHSEAYRELSNDGFEDQYWDTLFRTFPPGIPLHFLINMTLTFDDSIYDPSWFT